MPSRKPKAEREASKVKNSLAVIKWIQNNCRVPEGKDVGREVRLRDWQKREIEKILRQPGCTRRAIISFGAECQDDAGGVSDIGASGGADGADQRVALSAAQSRDQAAILYALAAKIVRMSPRQFRLRQHAQRSSRTPLPALSTLCWKRRDGGHKISLAVLFLSCAGSWTRWPSSPL